MSQKKVPTYSPPAPILLTAANVGAPTPVNAANFSPSSFGAASSVAPNVVPGADATSQGMALANQYFGPQMGAQAQGLSDIAQGQGYYSNFGPTSLAQALAANQFQNIWPNEQAMIGNQFSNSGMAGSPALAGTEALAYGQLGANVGEFLSNQSNANATNNLNYLMGMNPNNYYGPIASAIQGQSNQQAGLSQQTALQNSAQQQAASSQNAAQQQAAAEQNAAFQQQAGIANTQFGQNAQLANAGYQQQAGLFNTGNQNAYQQALAQQQYQQQYNKYAQQNALAATLGQISPAGGQIYGGITGTSGSALGGTAQSLGQVGQLALASQGIPSFGGGGNAGIGNYGGTNYGGMNTSQAYQGGNYSPYQTSAGGSYNPMNTGYSPSPTSNFGTMPSGYNGSVGIPGAGNNYPTSSMSSFLPGYAGNSMGQLSMPGGYQQQMSMAPSPYYGGNSGSAVMGGGSATGMGNAMSNYMSMLPMYQGMMQNPGSQNNQNQPISYLNNAQSAYGQPQGQLNQQQQSQ